MVLRRCLAVIVTLSAVAAASCTPPPGTGPLTRARVAMGSVLPPGWSAPPMSLINGVSSYTRPGPVRIEVGSYHANSEWEKLRFTMAHEFGHVVALTRGTGRYLGAPPAGWPGADDAEAFAHCVAVTLVPNTWKPYRGLSPCPEHQRAWIRAFLAAPH